jgi:cobalamin biosynthesis Mg chelatase CobN
LIPIAWIASIFQKVALANRVSPQLWPRERQQIQPYQPETTGSSSTESSTSTVAQAQTPTSNSTSTAAQAQTPTSNSTSTAAQAQTPTSNSTSTAAQAQTPTSKTDDALIGGIVGGIVGFLFLVGAVIAAVIIIGRRRRATTETEYGVVPQKQLSEPNAYGSQLTSKDVTAANYSELKSSEI